MKIFTSKQAIIFSSLCTIASCGNTPVSDSGNVLGIYKVSDRNCKGTPVEIEDCNSVMLMEFVKGNFYKIADNEVAFVIWRGESGSDLLYTARKYEGNIKFQNTSLNTIISDDEKFKEEIRFLSQTKAIYSLEKKSSQSQAVTTSELTLEKATATDLHNYILEYPGND